MNGCRRSTNSEGAAPPPPCFAWSPSPASQGRISGAAGTPWILRVDGHADRTPFRGGGRFASNWELSAARAIAVAQLLIGEGLPANRVAAAAFGDNQPIDQGDSPEALARNRRIELRLTDR